MRRYSFAISPYAGKISLLLCGLALVLAFPPFDQGWIIWVALIPGLVALRISFGLHRHPFKAGYIVGVIYFGGVFWWIGHVTILGTAALVLYMALYPALWFGVVEQYFEPLCGHSVISNLKFAVLGASWWVALEWMRGWLFTGFGWNNLGVALHANVPLIQLAGLGGVYLLSWLIVFVNITALRTFSRVYGDLVAHRTRTPLYEISIAMLLVALGFAWGFHRTIVPPEGTKIKTLSYACVQPDIPQNAYAEAMPTSEILQRFEYLSHVALASKPQLLLWPEATVGLELFHDERLTDLASRVAGNGDFYFLLGAMDSDLIHVYNSAFLMYPDWTRSGFEVYHKNKLVIFGEYVPLGEYVPSLRKLVPFGTDLTPGEKPARLKMPNLGLSVAPLICFEDTLPHQSLRAATLNPDIFINITNDSWFKKSPGSRQHLYNAIFRTVENDRPMIRCSNNGITCEINQYGRVITQLNARTSGVLAHEMYWYPAQITLYQRWGDWVPLISAIICAIGLIKRRLDR